MTAPAPTEFRLLRYGPQATTETREGLEAWSFEREDAERVTAAAQRPIAIDWEHQMLGLSPRADGLRPAAGWIGRLEVRDDGLWATRVEWSPTARAAIESGEYRYFSPVIFWADTFGGRAAELGPVGLTNDPLLRDALLTAAGAGGRAASRLCCEFPAASAASVCDAGAAATKPGPGMGAGATGTRRALGEKETDMELRAKIAEALGLGADATDEQILEALAARLGGAAALTAVARRLGVATGDGATLATAMERRIAEQAERDAQREARIAVLEQRAADAEFEQVLIAAKGKVAPAMREPLRTLFRADRAKFDAMLAGLPVLASEHSELSGSAGAAASNDDDPYLARLAHIRQEHKCSTMAAIRVVRTQEPDLLEAYRERQRAAAK